MLLKGIENCKSRVVATLKPTIGCHPAGHYVVPPTKDLKRSRECFHCHNKGHYARNCRTRKKAICEVSPATIRTTNVINDNHYKALKEENLEKPQLPTSTQFTKAIQNLNHSMLTMKQPAPPQGTKHLDAKEIKELIQANVTQYSQKERAELVLRLRDQMKQLLRTAPVAIPDPVTVINKASLMAMEHDTRLEDRKSTRLNSSHVD